MVEGLEIQSTWPASNILAHMRKQYQEQIFFSPNVQKIIIDSMSEIFWKDGQREKYTSKFIKSNMKVRQFILHTSKRKNKYLYASIFSSVFVLVAHSTVKSSNRKHITCLLQRCSKQSFCKDRKIVLGENYNVLLKSRDHEANNWSLSKSKVQKLNREKLITFTEWLLRKRGNGK